jgi:hypothetical protein
VFGRLDRAEVDRVGELLVVGHRQSNRRRTYLAAHPSRGLGDRAHPHILRGLRYGMSVSRRMDPDRYRAGYRRGALQYGSPTRNAFRHRWFSPSRVDPTVFQGPFGSRAERGFSEWPALNSGSFNEACAASNAWPRMELFVSTFAQCGKEQNLGNRS